MARKAVSEPLVCPVTAKRAVTELSSCPEPTTEIVYELVSCLDPAIDAIGELPTYPVMAAEAAVNLSVLSVKVRSAPPWWSSAPPCWLSAPPWESLDPSGPPWWSSAQLWWSSALPAPPWLSALPAPPWLSASPWHPAQPALPQSPVPPLPYRPGPPSLPLYGLRSTYLLDFSLFCLERLEATPWWGVLSRSLAGVPVSFARGHSIPDLYHSIKDFISHNPLPGLISTHCLHLCLIYPVCSPYISLVQFVILCKVLCVCVCVCVCVIAAILSLVPRFCRLLVPGPVTLPIFWINPLSVFALLLLFGLITCVWPLPVFWLCLWITLH